MPATDQEIAAAQAAWSRERESLGTLQNDRDALVAQRTTLNLRIQSLNSDIDSARVRVADARRALRELLTQP